MYLKVAELDKKGLNPTVNVRLTPEDHSRVLLNYLEKNNTGFNGAVNTAVTIVVSYPGPVIENDDRIVSSLNLTSENYSHDFYFEQLEKELTLLINKFLKSLPKEYGTYNIDLEVYSDVSNDQVLAYGTYNTTGCDGYPGCGSNIILNCPDITIGVNNYESTCNNSSIITETTPPRYYNCNWVNAACYIGPQCENCSSAEY
jgi:hypothetical protein